MKIYEGVRKTTVLLLSLNRGPDTKISWSSETLPKGTPKDSGKNNNKILAPGFPLSNKKQRNITNNFQTKSNEP